MNTAAWPRAIHIGALTSNLNLVAFAYTIARSYKYARKCESIRIRIRGARVHKNEAPSGPLSQVKSFRLGMARLRCVNDITFDNTNSNQSPLAQLETDLADSCCDGTDLSYAKPIGT